jgi:membrane protein CcdC involved in cytochrome C biogenesis
MKKIVSHNMFIFIAPFHRSTDHMHDIVHIKQIFSAILINTTALNVNFLGSPPEKKCPARSGLLVWP